MSRGKLLSRSFPLAFPRSPTNPNLKSTTKQNPLAENPQPRGNCYNAFTLLCQCEFSEPASEQTHIFSQLQSGVLVKCLPLRTISWISQLRFCYPNLCLGIWYAFVSFGIHGNIILVLHQICIHICRFMSGYLRYHAKNVGISLIQRKTIAELSMNFDGTDEKWYQITALIAYPNPS